MQTTAQDPLKDARQAAQIAGRFRDLQGLRQVAGGVGLLCLAAWEMLSPLSRDAIRTASMGWLLGSLAVVIACFALALVGFWRITIWYTGRYGRVEQTARQRRLGRVIGGTGALAFLLPFEIDIVAANGGSVPVNLMLFTMSLWIVGYWLYIGRAFWHYPVIAGVGLVLGFLSIAGIPPNTFAWHLREATLYIALATIVGGLIDHIILTRSMSPPESPLGVSP